MKHIVMFSGGIGSWAAGKLVVRRHGAADTLLLSADPCYEDPDTYRWRDAAAANVGAELVVIQEGRDIWQVFEDERYLGNTRADPCSKILKREICDRWIAERFTPDTCIRYVGIHASEEHRYRRIRERLHPWRVEAPLCQPPLLGYSELHDWALREGLWKQRLYQLGFPHANCGGRCVKQGQAGWRHLLNVLPERYAECEAKEAALRAKLGKDVSILRDRTNGGTKPLTLRQFRERIQAGAACDLFDWGGCGCFSGDISHDDGDHA